MPLVPCGEPRLLAIGVRSHSSPDQSWLSYACGPVTLLFRISHINGREENR
jgi:hypothetical protein